MNALSKSEKAASPTPLQTKKSETLQGLAEATTLLRISMYPQIWEEMIGRYHGEGARNLEELRARDIERLAGRAKSRLTRFKQRKTGSGFYFTPWEESDFSEMLPSLVGQFAAGPLANVALTKKLISNLPHGLKLNDRNGPVGQALRQHMQDITSDLIPDMAKLIANIFNKREKEIIDLLNSKVYDLKRATKLPEPDEGEAPQTPAQVAAAQKAAAAKTATAAASAKQAAAKPGASSTVSAGSTIEFKPAPGTTPTTKTSSTDDIGNVIAELRGYLESDKGYLAEKEGARAAGVLGTLGTAGLVGLGAAGAAPALAAVAGLGAVGYGVPKAASAAASALSKTRLGDWFGQKVRVLPAPLREVQQNIATVDANDKKGLVAYTVYQAAKTFLDKLRGGPSNVESKTLYAFLDDKFKQYAIEAWNELAERYLIGVYNKLGNRSELAAKLSELKGTGGQGAPAPGEDKAAVAALEDWQLGRLAKKDYGLTATVKRVNAAGKTIDSVNLDLMNPGYLDLMTDADAAAKIKEWAASASKIRPAAGKIDMSSKPVSIAHLMQMQDWLIGVVLSLSKRRLGSTGVAGEDAIKKWQAERPAAPEVPAAAAPAATEPVADDRLFDEKAKDLKVSAEAAIEQLAFENRSLGTGAAARMKEIVDGLKDVSGARKKALQGALANADIAKMAAKASEKKAQADVAKAAAAAGAKGQDTEAKKALGEALQAILKSNGTPAAAAWLWSMDFAGLRKTLSDAVAGDSLAADMLRAFDALKTKEAVLQLAGIAEDKIVTEDVALAHLGVAKPQLDRLVADGKLQKYTTGYLQSQLDAVKKPAAAPAPPDTSTSSTGGSGGSADAEEPPKPEDPAAAATASAAAKAATEAEVASIRADLKEIVRRAIKNPGSKGQKGQTAATKLSAVLQAQLLTKEKPREMALTDLNVTTLAQLAKANAARLKAFVRYLGLDWLTGSDAEPDAEPAAAPPEPGTAAPAEPAAGTIPESKVMPAAKVPAYLASIFDVPNADFMSFRQLNWDTPSEVKVFAPGSSGQLKALKPVLAEFYTDMKAREPTIIDPASYESGGQVDGAKLAGWLAYWLQDAGGHARGIIGGINMVEKQVSGSEKRYLGQFIREENTPEKAPAAQPAPATTSESVWSTLRDLKSLLV